MFTKIGESIEITRVESTQSCIPAVSSEVLERFRKFASNLKKIAPKAENFLYFSAVIMHSAEASALNDDGSIKLTASGDPVKVGWNTSNDTWRWESNDPNVKCYKNSNGDIFPESELIKAYKKWIGKPLCIDHKSSSVDHVRGFIVDTYYDYNLKRVIALCALDKENYPDLARKVSTGYSSSVSMGTAVGRAICTDCGKVARIESDFCEHMRNKTGYGEINIDLNPIELSIVVNGADPKAHIKHIIAAANNLNNYIDTKTAALEEAGISYSANILVMDGKSSENGELKSNHSVPISGETIEELKDSFEKACKSLDELKEDTNNAAFNQSSGTVAMDETVTSNTDFGLAPPHLRYASTNVEANLVTELRTVMSAVETKLSQMKLSLDKIEKTSTNLQEENMSGSKINKEGYFQGAEGGEPTPGKPKYPVDPTNEKLREHGDKHMDADNTGPTTGLYPGDLEQKKMLARAEAEQRAMKRNAVVELAKKALEQNKRAYFQGAGGENEPTPGKPKYPVDPKNVQLREKEDKQMVGQKPFPGVGSVDGLHPSPTSADVADEKKRKELLQRASLRARFVKAANSDGTQNLGGSTWEVFLGNKPLLTASVNELSGGRAGVLYDTIATREFGSKLIEKIKVHGADKVRDLVKSAQTPPAPAPAVPVSEVPAPVEDMDPSAEDTGKSGDPEEIALDLAEKVRDLSSDLVESVRALTGEQAEMGEMETPEMGAPEMGIAASSETNTLNTLRKELNGALTHAMKEAVAELNARQQELEMISGMYVKGGVNNSNKEFVGSIIDEALTEAKTCVADGMKLMTAFIKYARGTKAIVKRAQIEKELAELAGGDDMTTDEVVPDEVVPDDDMKALIDDTNGDLDAVESLLNTEYDPDVSDEDLSLEVVDDGLADEFDEGFVADNIVTDTPAEAAQIATQVPTGTDVIVDPDYTTKQARASLRAKFAAETLADSKMPAEAHPGGGFTTQLDVKPEGDLAKIEVLEETQKAMLDLANAPPKVRKEAEAIHMLVSQGKLQPTNANFNALIAEGLDKDAVSYYKQYYSQTDGGSEFASELVKEHVKAEMETELNTYKIKMARAYELAYDMVSRGLCASETSAVAEQVDEIMKFNDDSFESLKKVVAKHNPMRKEAGHMPQVGMIGVGETPVALQEGDLVASLSAALSKTNKRMF